MMTCDICGKGIQYGHNVRHTHSCQWMKRASKTRRVFLPNLHQGNVILGGVVKNVRACASCLKQYRAPRALLQKKYTPATPAVA